MPEIRVSYPVPYLCQFASRARTRVRFEELPLESDPRWAEYGAESPAQYAHWARRSCGVVCVKIAVEALAGCPPQTIMNWVKAGLALDGYLTELRSDRPDRPIEKGWKHAALAKLAVERGCDAEMVAPLGLHDLVAHIQADRLVIASVTSELGKTVPSPEVRASVSFAASKWTKRRTLRRSSCITHRGAAPRCSSPPASPPSVSSVGFRAGGSSSEQAQEERTDEESPNQ
jgi:hypothetical protein